MRLYQQLILFMLAATLLPLALLGFWLLRESERELALRISGEQRAQAEAAAESAGKSLLDGIEAIARSASLFDWSKTSADEARGGLSLLYQQSPAVSAVVLLSASTEVLEGPIYRLDGEGGHPGFDARAGLQPLIDAVPPGTLRGARGETALSGAYVHSLQKMAAVAVAVKLDEGPGSPVAVVELGLEPVQRILAGRASASVGRIELVDRSGRVVASSGRGTVLAPLAPAIWKEVQQRVTSAEVGQSFTVRLEEPYRVAAASVPGELGLFTVVSLPERVALAPVRAMRRTVLVSLGGALLVLLAVGALFTRRLSSRVAAISEGADAYATGNLSKRIPVTGADELTDLSVTFNRMGAELEAARGKLLRWNDELKQRVDEATAELRQAQAQLLETQKLAAVGQLGAGVAHEINNPLAGILGNTQLLLLEREEKDPDFQSLKKIEQMAKRCKEITQNLLRFSQQRDKPEVRPTDLNAVVRDALSLSMTQAQGEGVHLVSKLAPGQVMVRADPAHISQVVLAFFANARTAMQKAPVKELRVTTREDGESAVIEVKDTGKGIRADHLQRIFEPFFTTKDTWSNVGLGLSVAYRIATEHGGKIDVQTEVGKGSTFTLRLPKSGPANAVIDRASAPKQAHGALAR